MSNVYSIKEIKKAEKSFSFFANVCVKAIKIFFRSDRKIKMIHASFSNRKVANSTVVKFRFRNSLWYEFENVITDKRELSITKTGFLEKRTLLVHGFFTTKKYILTFDENSQLEKRARFCQSEENLKTFESEVSYSSSVLVRN